jgi:helix-turn-helix protein
MARELQPQEIAERWQVSRRFVNALVLAGKLKGRKLGGAGRGGYWLVTETSVKRYEEANRPAPNPDRINGRPTNLRRDKK